MNNWDSRKTRKNSEMQTNQICKTDQSIQNPLSKIINPSMQLFYYLSQNNSDQKQINVSDPEDLSFAKINF